MASSELPKAPDPLPSPVRLLVALAALSATLHPPNSDTKITSKWYQSTTTSWLRSISKLMSLDPDQLPSSVDPVQVKASAEEQRDEWSQEDKLRIAGILVEASLASEASSINAEGKDEKKDELLRYTPLAKALSHRTLELLGLPADPLLPEAENNLSSTLFKALQAAGDGASEKVESARAAHSQGWGGKLGRTLATGAGVIAGGVLIGVTGGLAAPAIAALLAPLGIGSILSATAAPVVLGTLFGVGGGGLAGRRVRERWGGVDEFGFVEVGHGTSATKEEIEDLKEVQKNVRKKDEEAKKKAEEDKQDTVAEKESEIEGQKEVKEGEIVIDAKETTDADEASEDTKQEVERSRTAIEERLLKLSLTTGPASLEPGSPDTTRVSTDSVRPSLDSAAEEKALVESKKPPSLTATIVVPGLLTVSKTEAITAWRAVCSGKSSIALDYQTREKGHEEQEKMESHTGLSDGRDVYLLRYETGTMLKTGRDVDLWVTSKIKGVVKKQIIKRTVLKAYFAAVSLPMSVYSMATMTLDNTWMHAQDRAKKAGRLLGEVLEKRVQGERPVVLIGSSLGAYTVLQALLYLSTLPPPMGSSSAIPQYVESAYLISLPSSPTAQEWAACRSVVARRLVNAWSDSDLVLAGVVRLHEVVSRAVELSNGIMVAGLGPVRQAGVEDVDVSGVLRGHMELQAKMGDILEIIDIDG